MPEHTLLLLLSIGVPVLLMLGLVLADSYWRRA